MGCGGAAGAAGDFGPGGFYRNSRKLGRTFAAAVTREEYVAMQVKLAILEARRLTGIDPEKLLKDLSAKAADGFWEETA